jgi:hypothetical protein
MGIPQYTFQARWKEQLVCCAGAQQFVLEFPMGIPTIYLPTKSRWRTVAPAWASDHWDYLYDQLGRWCKAEDVQLVVDETAQVDV